MLMVVVADLVAVVIKLILQVLLWWLETHPPEVYNVVPTLLSAIKEILK
jgi:hypothetical protein